MKNKRLVSIVTVLMLLVSIAFIIPVFAAEKVKLTVWYPWGGIDGDVRKELCESFTKKNPDIQVEATMVNGAGIYDGKFAAAVKAGNAPDLVIFWDPGMGSALAEQGMIMDVTDMAKEIGVDWSKFFPTIVEQSMYKGRYYSFPEIAANGYVMLINRGKLREAGIPDGWVPKTTADIEKMAPKYDKKRPNGTYERILFDPYMAFRVATWSAAFGGKLFSDDNKTVVIHKDKQIYKMLQWMQGYFKKYGAPTLTAMAQQSQNSGGLQTPNHPFITGACPIMFDGSWMGKYAQQFVKNPDDVEVLPPPMVTGGLEKPISYIAANCLFVPKGTKNLKEVGLLVKYMLEPERMAKLADSVGNMPPYPSALKFQKLSKEPTFKTLYEQMDKLAPGPVQTSVGWKYMNDNWGSLVLDPVCIQGKPIQPTLNEFAKKVQAEIDRLLK